MATTYIYKPKKAQVFYNQEQILDAMALVIVQAVFLNVIPLVEAKQTSEWPRARKLVEEYFEAEHMKEQLFES